MPMETIGSKSTTILRPGWGYMAKCVRWRGLVSPPPTYFAILAGLHFFEWGGDLMLQYPIYVWAENRSDPDPLRQKAVAEVLIDDIDLKMSLRPLLQLIADKFDTAVRQLKELDPALQIVRVERPF